MDDTERDALKKEIYDALHHWFGYDSFRSRQYDAIRAILEGKDVVVLMPTGGGKSLCYQIPPLVHNTMCVVVSPLIALMQDQIRELKHRNIPCALLSSAQSTREYRSVLASLSKPNCNYNLLYVTPERLQITEFLSILQSIHQRGALSLIAIDEAHCISTWGHDFRAAYRGLSSIRDCLPSVPIMALSATATTTIVNDIKSQLHIESALTISKSFDRPNIFYSIVNSENISKYDHLRGLLSNHPNQSVIIYVRKRDEAVSIRDNLLADGFAATVYHGSLPNKEKEEALNSWIQDKSHVIVATIAFGMGINKNNVRLIIHWNLPQSLYNYYQESGRAGRDGKKSESVVYYSKDDVTSIVFTIKHDSDEKRVERLLDEFKIVINFCTENKCRRKALLQYFQQTKPRMNPVECCDYCKNPEEVKMGSTVYKRLPTSELIHPGTQFQSARQLYEQSLKEEEEDETVMKKRKWNSSVYHVNERGEFTDSEEEEEEEDLHSQLKRMALSNTLPYSTGFSKASSLMKRESFSKPQSSETVQRVQRIQKGQKVCQKDSSSILDSFRSSLHQTESSRKSHESQSETNTLKKAPVTPVKQNISSTSSSPSLLTSSPTKPILSLSSPNNTAKISQLLKDLTEELSSLQPVASIPSKQRVKCINALKEKFQIALKPFLPEELVELVSLQQARLQEHSLIMTLRTVQTQEGKQQDIRALFGKKKKTVMNEKDSLKQYKNEYTTIFGEVSLAGKNGLVPPFLPLDPTLLQTASDMCEDNLRLMSKCRISLLPFFHPDCVQQVLKHVVVLISMNTPNDETKDEYVKTIHLRVNKTIKKKQPFLIKKDV